MHTKFQDILISGSRFINTFVTMGTFSKFAKVARVHFSSWKQSIVGVSASWPHAIDTPTSHWHGVSSEECLGDGQPLLLEQTQKSWQCSRWWMVLPDLSLQVVPKIFYLIEIRAAGWPVHPDHPWPPQEVVHKACTMRSGVVILVDGSLAYPA